MPKKPLQYRKNLSNLHSNFSRSLVNNESILIDQSECNSNSILTSENALLAHNLGRMSDISTNKHDKSNQTNNFDNKVSICHTNCIDFDKFSI